MDWTDYLDYSPVGLGLRAGNYLARLIMPEQRQSPPPRRPAPPRPTPAPTPAPSPRSASPRGGRGTPTPAPSRGGRSTIPAGTTDAYLQRWGNKDPAELRQIYQNARASVVRRLTDPAQRERALARFDTDPRTQAIRQLAGLERVTTTRAELRDVARRAQATRSALINEAGRNAARERQGANTGFTSALGAGIRRSLFGLPERLAAAGLYYTGQSGNLNYDETLQATRAATDEELSRSTSGNIIGQIMGSFGGGGVAGNLITRGAGRLAASGAPIAQRAGNVLQSLTQLRQGQRLANTGRIALAGAAGGAAQAAGEGSDVIEGALTGAIAAPAVHGGIQLARLGGRQGGRLIRQVTRPFSSSVPRAIREVITEAPEAVVSRQRALSNQIDPDGNTNVPVVAALRDQDFRTVVDKVVMRSPEATEIARGHSGRYLRGFMDRMLGHVNRAGREGDAIPTSIGELAQLRRDTADELMHPIRDRTVDLTRLPLDDLERQVTRQIGGRIQGLAPRINEALRDLSPDDLNGMGLDASDVANARRLMTDWGLGTPVHATVQEMDSLRRALDAAAKSSQNSNPANAMAFRNASRAVREFTTSEVPAYGQMVDTYAAQSRMMEGFETAAAGRRIEDIEDDLLRSNLRTPEGRIGMKAGELFRQREAVTGRPTGAIAAARDFASEGRLTRPASIEPGAARPGTVTENLGDRAAAGLARASQGEIQVLDRMLNTDRLNALAQNEQGTLNPMDIARMASISGAMTETKIRVVSAILKAMVGKLPTPMSKKVANNLADMLFSQDAAATQRAMTALRRAGLGERITTSLMRNALPNNIAVGMLAGGRGGPDAGTPSGGNTTSVEGDLGGEGDYSQMSDEELMRLIGEGGDADYSQMSDEELMQAIGQDSGESPYAQDLQHIYDTENPELLDLISRVENQESGGRQHGDDGRPLTSSAGAVGVMQVMPGTAPEAAAIAGVPWDENAYRNDPTYNRILGIAYLSEMLRRYDGDVELALIAYNAGPGRADEIAAGRGQLPAETQDYVSRITE